jgi:hypothetical protein
LYPGGAPGSVIEAEAKRLIGSGEMNGTLARLMYNEVMSRDDGWISEFRLECEKLFGNPAFIEAQTTFRKHLA